MSKRVVYRVLAEDGIQDAARGFHWKQGALVEGGLLGDAWVKGLLRDHAIEVYGEEPKLKGKKAEEAS